MYISAVKAFFTLGLVGVESLWGQSQVAIWGTAVFGTSTHTYFFSLAGKVSIWSFYITFKINSICTYLCVSLPALACLPETLDGTLFADVTFGLVLCWLCSSHTVEDRQPNHRLGLQAHPLQEVRHLNGRFPWGLGKEGGRDERSAGDCKQSKYRKDNMAGTISNEERVCFLFQRWSSSERV